jgi:biotin-(acetyl-CoA carboxylase) ligase
MDDFHSMTKEEATRIFYNEQPAVWRDIDRPVQNKEAKAKAIDRYSAAAKVLNKVPRIHGGWQQEEEETRRKERQLQQGFNDEVNGDFSDIRMTRANAQAEYLKLQRDVFGPTGEFETLGPREQDVMRARRKMLRGRLGLHGDDDDEDFDYDQPMDQDEDIPDEINTMTRQEAKRIFYHEKPSVGRDIDQPVQNKEAQARALSRYVAAAKLLGKVPRIAGGWQREEERRRRRQRAIQQRFNDAVNGEYADKRMTRTNALTEYEQLRQDVFGPNGGFQALTPEQQNIQMAKRDMLKDRLNIQDDDEEEDFDDEEEDFDDDEDAPVVASRAQTTPTNQGFSPAHRIRAVVGVI